MHDEACASLAQRLEHLIWRQRRDEREYADESRVLVVRHLDQFPKPVQQFVPPGVGDA